MTHVQSFTNLGEMFDHMAQNQQAALAGLHPAQRDIDYGDYWVQFSEYGLIFGYVHTLAEIEKAERDYAPTEAAEIPAFEQELAEVLTNTQAMMETGLMYGTAYSPTERDGELGHTHKSCVWPITKQTFDMALAAGWVQQQMIEACRVNLSLAGQALRAHRVAS